VSICAIALKLVAFSCYLPPSIIFHQLTRCQSVGVCMRIQPKGIIKSVKRQSVEHRELTIR